MPTGQKVWSTWAHDADFGVILARTDPDATEAQGHHLLPDRPAPARRRGAPLRHITGEVDFNETFLDGARVPDSHRVGAVGDGWKVANATLSGERQMVRGPAPAASTASAARRRRAHRGAARGSGPLGQTLSCARTIMRLLSEERIRGWTNQRVRAGLKTGRSPGPESSIGKVHQGSLNQRIQPWPPTCSDRRPGLGRARGRSPDAGPRGLRRVASP